MSFSHRVISAALFSALFILAVPVARAADQGSAAPQLRLPPAALQTPAKRTFMVYFDFDSAALSSQAHDLLAHVADVAQRDPDAFVTVTGHTDAAGSRFYNLGLSKDRAIAVRNALSRAGVPPSRVQVYWRGEFELLVPTADGVNEFRNRRAEIVVE